MPTAADRPFLVVGSGASAVHFALSALERGHAVTMLDVGFERPPAVEPTASFPELKRALPDPVEYFLGPHLEHVVYPSPGQKPYGFPPSKQYVFRRPAHADVRSAGFDPVISYARGGLAEAWTGGCYELSEHDVGGWPVSHGDLLGPYALVSRRIGLSGANDDMARFAPMSADYQPALSIDPHSQTLLDRYARSSSRIHERMRFYLGRSRVATISRDVNGRQKCVGLGRCLWGCPHQALYSPGITLQACLRHTGFRYLPGHLVREFEFDSNGTVRTVTATSLVTGETVHLDPGTLVLAAGTLGTTRLYLASLRRVRGQDVALSGLLDNPQAMIPFVNLTRLGSSVELASYQFHHLAFGIAGADGGQAAHGQITTLRAASVHPIAQTLPFGLRDAMRVFRRIRSALGVANLWLPGVARAGNVMRLEESAAGEARLAIDCEDDPETRHLLETQVAVVQKALRALGCVAPGAMTRLLPLGSSVHYAGTLPMSVEEREHTCTADGRVRGFRNLIVADGAGFPTLPAKNLTFTLMANAARLAALACDT